MMSKSAPKDPYGKEEKARIYENNEYTIEANTLRGFLDTLIDGGQLGDKNLKPMQVTGDDGEPRKLNDEEKNNYYKNNMHWALTRPSTVQTGGNTLGYVHKFILKDNEFNLKYLWLESPPIWTEEFEAIGNKIIAKNIHSDGWLEIGGNKKYIAKIFNIKEHQYLGIIGEKVEVGNNEITLQDGDEELSNILILSVDYVDKNRRVIVKDNKSNKNIYYNAYDENTQKFLYYDQNGSPCKVTTSDNIIQKITCN